MFTFDLTQKVSGEKTINAKVAISRNGKYGLTAFSEKTAVFSRITAIIVSSYRPKDRYILGSFTFLA